MADFAERRFVSGDGGLSLPALGDEQSLRKRGVVGVPTLSRVVWSEGMFLAQHHFQTQSRYFEKSVHFALSSVFSGSWGFLSVELDEDALWNGTLSVQRLTGVMPDGLPFDLGDSEPLPASRSIGDVLGANAEGQALYLAIPRYRERQANCESGDGDGHRYRLEQIDVFDETTGADHRPVAVGVKNFRLLLESELDDGVVAMPLALVQADGTGHYVTDPDFIPPCVAISASSRLTAMLRRLLEMMEAKAASVAGGAAADGHRLGELAAAELANYWLTHALYSAMGPLRHHAQSRAAHPRRLYEDLSRLAGALCTFSVDAHVGDIPAYDHGNPTHVFRELEAQIRRHLDVVVRDDVLTFPLPRTAEHVHGAVIADVRVLSAPEWILSIESAVPESHVIEEFRRKGKVASSEDVMRLVGEGVAGLTVEHIASPPVQVRARVGCQYFRVLRDGFAWELARERQSIGVYVPESLADARVTLSVILA